MGIFLTYSKKDEIKKEIHRFLRNKDIELFSEKEDGPDKNTIIAEGHISKHLISLIWEIEPYGNSNSVKMEVRPSRSLQTVALMKTLFFIAVLLILPIIFKKYWTGTAQSAPILKISVLVLIYAGLQWIHGNKIKNVFNKIEAEFRIFVKENIIIIIESPPNGRMLPTGLDLVLNIFLWFSFLFITYEIFPIMFYLLLVPMGLSLMQILLSHLAIKEKYLIWKTMLIWNVFRWLLMTGSIIFFLFTLYILNSYFFISYENIIYNKNISYKEAISTEYFRHSLESFKHQPKDKVKYKFQIMNEITEKKLNELYKEINDSDREKLNKVQFSNLALQGVLIIGITIIAYLLALRSLFKIPGEWPLFVGESFPTPIKPPSISTRSNLRMYLYNIILIIWILFAVFINFIFAILCIDIISYVIVNDTLIIKELSSLFSWIPTISIIFSKLYSPSSETLFLWISKIFLLFFASAFLYVLLRWIANVFKRTMKGLYYIINKARMKKALSMEARKAISEISSKYNLKNPKIRITSSKRIVMNGKMGIFSTRAIITINKEIINVLNEGEIIAIIAHEMAHIKYDVRKMELLKLMSRLALFPNFFLTIFLNYRKMEERADKFAVEATKTKSDLKNALIKISTLSLFVGKDSNKRKNIKQKDLNILKKIHVFDEFFFGEALIGYSHLGMIERLKEIEKAY
jgi:Zn-dependent protease with chaperone function